MDEREKRCAAGAWAQDAYQCSIAAAAYARHPTVQGLKGVVHEYGYVVHHNTNFAAILEKGFARVNPNPRAPLHDVQFGDGSGLQLKDTCSLTGARETARRAAEYGDCLRGTHETVEAVAKQGVTIQSSGISSAHNEGIAARVGCDGRLSARALAHNVKSSAASGAMFAGGLALYNGWQRVSAGEATWADVLPEVAREVVIGAGAAGIAAAAGTAVSAMMPAGNVALLVSFVVMLLVAALASRGINALWDEWFAQPQCVPQLRTT